MPELIDANVFSFWFGVACAIWTGVWSFAAGARRRRDFFVIAAGGVVAYVLWVLYRAVAGPLDILTVRGVLALVGIFVLAGAILGLLGRRRS